ncbi:hypothetical protein SprV_0200773200 [Sparganum proliferum]
MLMDAYRNEPDGIRIAYRTDGHLLNSRCLHNSTRLPTTTIHDPLFADDRVLNTVAEADMQRSTNLFVSGCGYLGLVVNMEKTVVVHQPPSSAVYSAPGIYANGTQMKKMDNFAHLGSKLPRCIKMDDKVTHRISKASQAFGRLQNSA